MVKLLFSVMCILMSVSGFAQEQIKIKHGPYLQNLKETEVTIVWLSDKPSIGWVEIAPDDGTSYYRTERIKFFDTVNGVKNVSELHAVRARALLPVLATVTVSMPGRCFPAGGGGHIWQCYGSEYL